MDPKAYDARSLLVRFREDTSSAEDSAAQLQGPLAFSDMVDVGQSLLPGLQRVALPDGMAVETALKAWRGFDAVLYVEPVFRIQVCATPDDPRFDELWGFHNDAQSGGTVDADIDAPEAWDATVGSGNTIVAVIDTGVDYSHPDLQANMWVNADEIPGDGLDNDGNGFVDDIHGYDFANHDADPRDDNNHGTHVAGTIAAAGDNKIGVTGINWHAQIMALKFLNAQGSGDTDDAIEALNYAVANGAKISNNSWGFSGGFSQSLYDAIEAARDADHVFVAAAGNGNFLGIGMNNDATPFYPASYDLENIVAVAAVDHNDTKPLFSNYGATTVDLAAPGVDILSTYRNGTYGYSSGTSMASPHVAGVVALVRDQHPDWSYAQAINQVLQTVDPLSAMAGITTTGGRLNAAAAVGVDVVPSPDIQVLFASKNVADDSGVVDYGKTPPGLAIDYTFTVKNRGVMPLTLTEPITVPTGYSLAAGFGTTTLAVGASTTFTVRLDGSVEGTYAGEVSFANDDPDENPFNFAVTGTVAVPPAVQIIDNGDTAFSTVGEWTSWTGQGYEGDVHESYAGTGADVAAWNFERLLPGTYRAAATWTKYTNRAANAPFTIRDGATVLNTVAVNQQVAPSGFADEGVNWQYLGGPYTIAGNTLVVDLSDAADGRVNADAIRIERVEMTPEISVSGQGLNLADGSARVAFGTTTLGAPISITFTVQNLGAVALTLDEPIDIPNGFVLTSGFGATTLATDATTTFVVTLAATSSGTYGGEVSFASNDSDESPFTFTVEGAVNDPPAVQILDNGDASFTTVGEWTRWTGQGYESDIHESYAGTGIDVATWTFSNLLPGYYGVAATWTANSNRATNAPFAILDGTTTRSTTLVNQQVAPADFTDVNVHWDTLGGSVLVTSGTLVVQLNDAANGRLNADAIRIERLPDVPEIRVSAGTTNVLDGVSTIDFGETPPGVPATRVLTVENVGAQTLVLGEPITVSDGFSLATSFGTTALEPGESTTCAIRFDALEAGTTTAHVSFASNDSDESPFTFQVTGVAVVPPAVQIIDNGATGFSTVGEWTRWTGQGYENDIHESLPGTGTDVATWTFSRLMPGLYRVAATWTTHTNRASNAPLTIFDDSRMLTTHYVNQKLVPSGFSDAGVTWQYLGGVQAITSSTLVVRLTDAADGRLNADAIRIERLDPVPEIQVAQSTLNLVDDVSVVDFGSTTLGAPVTRTFVVTNRGGAPLHLSDSISVPPGFSLASPFSATTLGVDQSATFALQLDASSAASLSGTVAFENDDANENPFSFTVQATVLMPPAVVIVDNGDATFSTVGAWTRWTGQGYLSDIHESLLGTGADVASWTFTNLLPGLYRVSATWTTHTNRATNSPFTVLDGATSLATVAVNQRVAPSQFSDAGVYWNDLGSQFQIDSHTLVVRLTDLANGRVNADAIRIERLDAPIGGASLRGDRSSVDPALQIPLAASVSIPSTALHDRIFSEWPQRRLRFDAWIDHE